MKTDDNLSQDKAAQVNFHPIEPEIVMNEHFPHITQSSEREHNVTQQNQAFLLLPQTKMNLDLQIVSNTPNIARQNMDFQENLSNYV